MLCFRKPSAPIVLGDFTVVTTREVFFGFLVVLSMVLVETTLSTFLVVMGLLPISEVLTDVIFLVEVINGLLVAGFLVGPAAFG